MRRKREKARSESGTITERRRVDRGTKMMMTREEDGGGILLSWVTREGGRRQSNVCE